MQSLWQWLQFVFIFKFSYFASKDHFEEKTHKIWPLPCVGWMKIRYTQEICTCESVLRGLSSTVHHIKGQKKEVSKKMEKNEFSSSRTKSGQYLKTTHEHSEFLFWSTDPGFIELPCTFSYRRGKLRLPALSLKHLKQNCFLTDVVLHGCDPSQDKVKTPKRSLYSSCSY